MRTLFKRGLSALQAIMAGVCGWMEDRHIKGQQQSYKWRPRVVIYVIPYM